MLDGVNLEGGKLSLKVFVYEKGSFQSKDPRTLSIAPEMEDTGY